jgi:hypothetical protein
MFCPWWFDLERVQIYGLLGYKMTDCESLPPLAGYFHSNFPLISIYTENLNLTTLKQAYMKRNIFLCLLFLQVLSGCDVRQREVELQRKEAELNQKQQELLLKEKSLQLQEEELKTRAQKIDSTQQKAPDSASYNPELVGSWAARMNCIETSCPGSAVGDTKTEQWDISYQQNHIIARVMVNQKLVRTYSGLYNGTSMELTSGQGEEASQASGIVVRLQQTGKEHLEGRREISRQTGCKIVFALDLVKL